MIFVLAIRSKEEQDTKHITALRIQYSIEKKVEEIPIEVAIDFVEKKPGSIVVAKGHTLVDVQVVSAELDDGKVIKYLRTETNESLKDNLLSLPRF